MRNRLWPGIAIAAIGVAVTSVFMLDLCNLIYRCGCDHLWGEAAAHCNIHTPGAKHCPWCTLGPVGGFALYGAIIAPQIVLAFVPSRWTWKRRLLAVLLAFPLAGGLEGVVLGVAQGYWSNSPIAVQHNHGGH